MAEQPKLPVKPFGKPLYVHSNCHQKAHDAVTPKLGLLRRILEVEVSLIESSCCGMAGAFGYAPDTLDVTLKMAILGLFPALEAIPDTAVPRTDEPLPF